MNEEILLELLRTHGMALLAALVLCDVVRTMVRVLVERRYAEESLARTPAEFADQPEEHRDEEPVRPGGFRDHPFRRMSDCPVCGAPPRKTDT
jgi:hypothetical protein